MSALRIGAKFCTPVECGCVVLSEPDEFGGFIGLDSDGVECHFHVSMVIPPSDECEETGS